MIQKTIRDSRGEVIELDHNDARYWEGQYRYEPYPKALYCQLQPGEPCETRVVKSEAERTMLGSAWFESPADAQAHFERLEADMAKAAAERNWSDRRLSTRAQAEALEADRATDEMVADIPRKPGRPKKVQTES